MIAETGYTRLKYLKGAAIHEYKKNMFFVATISFIIAQLSDALIINAGAYDDCDSDYSVNTELKCLSYLITTQSAEYTWLILKAILPQK